MLSDLSWCVAGVSALSITYLAAAALGGSQFADLAASLKEGVAAYPALWTTGKFAMALPLCYHLFNGVRHLVCCASVRGSVCVAI